MSDIFGLPDYIDPLDLDEQREFSWETFGSPEEHRESGRTGSPVAGVIDHIRKELVEIEEGSDENEWIDVIILAFDGALRDGWTPEQIITGYHSKMAINKARKWPDWRTAEPGKAIEHIRDET